MEQELKPKCRECKERKVFGFKRPNRYYFVYDEGIQNINLGAKWNIFGEYQPPEKYRIRRFKCSEGHEWSERLPEPPEEIKEEGCVNASV